MQSIDKSRFPIFVFVLILGSADTAPAAAPTAELPGFLPAYYTDALSVSGTRLVREMVDEPRDSADGARQAKFSSNGMTLLVKAVECVPPRCSEIHHRELESANQQATSGDGEFTKVEETEFSAHWRKGVNQTAVFAFELPRFAMLWTVEWPSARDFRIADYDSLLTKLTNRYRTEQAATSDNVEFGRWDGAIYDRSRDLLDRGDIKASQALLENLRSWAPTDYNAQMDYAEHAASSSKAQDSAWAVLDNAEDPALVARAHRFLHQDQPGEDSIPLISSSYTGLQAIFIALPPCDVALVHDAAAAHSAATGIPSQTVRLDEAWKPAGRPRVLFQTSIENTIVQLEKHDVDFHGWFRSSYAEELKLAALSADALTRFRARKIASSIMAWPDQYEVSPLLVRLAKEVSPIRVTSRQAVFVGITATPIYLGTSNFVFSASNSDIPQIGILSYAMMLAATLEDTTQSRPRLVERLAKEMVPATLRPLGLPRPADPSDPYSYSDGVLRLDQKTLKLSRSTRDALDELRARSP